MEIYENLSLEDLPNEEWRDICGYEGIYQVSSYGRIKSLSRLNGGEHNRHLTKKKIIKCKPNQNGYLRVNLHSNGKLRQFAIHRLVGLAFIPLVAGKYYIDHINGIRVDNRVENLRWCTHHENDTFPLAIENKKQASRKSRTPERAIKHRQAMLKYHNDEKWRLRMSEIVKKRWREDETFVKQQREVHNSKEFIVRCQHTTLCKPVLQFDLSGNFIREYFSASEATRITGINKIPQCCRGERHKAGGYKWKYKETE